MHKVVVFLALTGGLAFLVGEHASTPAEREAQVAAITRIVARASILEPEVVPAEQPGLRLPVTSPAAVYSMPLPAQVTAPETPNPSASTSRVAVAIDPAIPVTLTSPVTVQGTPDMKPAQAGETVQRRLAREIQQELKRVGCYSGRLDGNWGEQSRAAMQTFIEHVNASLPTHEPDVFLLSLIKTQAQPVCGPICAPADTASAGRCVARQQVANAEQRHRQADPAAEAGSQAATAARVDPLPGRMSIGGPAGNNYAAVTTEAPVTADGSTSPPVAAAGMAAEERLPWAGTTAEPPPSTLRMAALPPGDSASAFEQPPPVVRRTTRVKRGWTAPRPKPVKRRYSGSTRSVQNLFLHPLGRM